MPEFFQFFRLIFDTSDFPTRWHCGAWTRAMGWTSQWSDLMLFVAYGAIPLLLLWVWRRRRNDFGPSASFVLLLFVAFIALCGLTHLNSFLAFYWPAYRWFITVKFVAGLVSLAATGFLWPVAREAVRMPTREQKHALLNQVQRQYLLLELAYQELQDKLIQLEERRSNGGTDATSPTFDRDIDDLRGILESLQAGKDRLT